MSGHQPWGELTKRFTDEDRGGSRGRRGRDRRRQRPARALGEGARACRCQAPGNALVPRRRPANPLRSPPAIENRLTDLHPQPTVRSSQ